MITIFLNKTEKHRGSFYIVSFLNSITRISSRENKHEVKSTITEQVRGNIFQLYQDTRLWDTCRSSANRATVYFDKCQADIQRIVAEGIIR